MSAEDRSATFREALRVLRPGGRAMVIGSGRRTGLSSLLTHGPNRPTFDPGPSFGDNGFKPPRTLAEREGLVFVEAMKPRQAS